jgi:hypothetical protein
MGSDWAWRMNAPLQLDSGATIGSLFGHLVKRFAELPPRVVSQQSCMTRDKSLWNKKLLVRLPFEARSTVASFYGDYSTLLGHDPTPLATIIDSG